VVDNYGLVTAIGNGIAHIKVTTHSGVSAVCKFIAGSGLQPILVQAPAEEENTSATGSALEHTDY